jgi:adenosyl cobinamide kinase/adenosyl cobinamide phosphate guanylyltransferase
MLPALLFLIASRCSSVGRASRARSRLELGAARAVGALLDAYRASGTDWVLVSNEVGMGIVPENAWARA